MRDLFLIAVTPLALTAGACIGTLRMRLNWRTDLGLRLPTPSHALISTVAFLALASLHEFLNWWLGPDAATVDWRTKYSGGALIVRVVFASLVYPVAEEFFFRGFLLTVITKKLGPIGGIVLTATLFTVLHSLSGPSLGALQIFADGLFFAFVRLRTGSLLLPAAFHVLGNTFAVLQRLL